ncbi:MAG: single-stranded-DNA-specific exonuclease RecJ [Dethiobacteria bacterium]
MSFRGKRWIWPEAESDQVRELAQQLDLAPAFARLLYNRGITDPQQARAFLYPSLDQLHCPRKMLGMDFAVDRIVKAIEAGEKITIHGDYDADGITASVIMVQTLRALGGNTDYFLPSRFDEGYGLHTEPLRQFREAGTGLVITVDCGINAVEETKYASEIGLDMIITDHHQPLTVLHEPIAVINPLQKDCPYPFKELSGAGVAFKLATALYEKSGEPFPGHLLDLAALGTAADVVSLLGENRIIVSTGIEVLRRLERVGLKALADTVSLPPERINSRALSFILGPAVNAAGRMGEALPAAELLLETDLTRAFELAGKLHRANQMRRSTEQNILREAEAAALEQITAADQKVITLAAESWHHGVIGIVASRLVEKFNRPAALIALDGNEGRGSARSIPGFDITAALAESADILLRFGGHDQAAGFTVTRENVKELRERLNRYASVNLRKDELQPQLFLEAELEDRDIDSDLATKLELLQPYGTANPPPLLGSRSWNLLSWRLVGADNSHLKLNMKKGSKTISPVFFSAADLEPKLEKGRPVDLAFRLKNGYFRQQQTLDVELKDISYSDEAEYLGLTVVDKRGCSDRIGCLNEILADNNTKAALFTSTISRRRQVKDKCLSAGPACSVSSGSGNGSQQYPDHINAVVLFDLPLSPEPIGPFLKSLQETGSIIFYLLYGKADLQINRTIIDYSLPTPENLLAIIDELRSKHADTPFKELSLAANTALRFKPAATFWDRAAKILAETEIISADNILVKESGNFSERWIDALSQSPTYNEAMELRAECERFQKVLLENSPAEIAEYLQNLIPK